MSELLIEPERKAERNHGAVDLLEKEQPSLSLLELALDSKTDSSRLQLAAAKKPGVAETHTMAPRFLTLDWKFDIKDENGKSEGVIDQQLLNLRKTFDYKDASGKTIATGQERLFSWGTKIDVYDENGKQIGGINEQLFKGFFHTYTVYSIVDAQGKELAKSAKFELGATDFTLTNPKGEKIATIHRPWLNWLRDNWTIDIMKPQEVDKRILYLIPAYKTVADAERKAAEEAEEERKRKNKDDDDE